MKCLHSLANTVVLLFTVCGLLLYFIFVAIVNGIYHSSCFHRGINFFLYATGGTLFLLVIFYIIKDRETVRPSFNDYISVNHHGIVHDHIIQISENAPDEPMCLLDLL